MLTGKNERQLRERSSHVPDWERRAGPKCAVPIAWLVAVRRRRALITLAAQGAGSVEVGFVPGRVSAAVGGDMNVVIVVGGF